MTIFGASRPAIRGRVQTRLPATLQATGGLSVSKTSGVWTLTPDFSQLDEVLAPALTDPTSKQLWIYDPVTGQYNVLDLTGLGDALFKLTSTTSLAVGTGSKTFTTQSGKDIASGSYVLVVSDANPTDNFMFGKVVSYTATTLIASMSTSGGSGTLTDWTITAASPTGPTGSTGATGATGASVGFIQSYSVTVTDSVPVTASFQLNTTTIAAATAAYLSTFDSSGNLVSGTIDLWDDSTNTTKGLLQLTKIGSPGQWANFKVTGSVTATAGYSKLTLTSGTASTTTFTLADQFAIAFTPAGDKGSDGAGVGTVTGATSSTHGGLVIYSGTSGQLVQSTTITGIPKLTAGVLSTATIGSDYLAPTVASSLSAGFFASASYNIGTMTSGTLTLSASLGNIQHYVHSGSYTIGPPSVPCTMIVEATNASTGTLTITSTFNIVDGDTFSNSGTKKHLFYVTKTNSYARITVVYVTGT